jgi:hypothetical protein
MQHLEKMNMAQLGMILLLTFLILLGECCSHTGIGKRTTEYKKENAALKAMLLQLGKEINKKRKNYTI